MSSLLLDVGGTFIKSCIFDEQSNTLLNFQRSPICGFLDSNFEKRREISISQLENLLLDTIQSQLYYSSSVSRIFVSGQMGSWTIDGLSEYQDKIISWQDCRVLENYEDTDQLLGNFGLSSVVQVNGNEKHFGTPLIGIFSDYNTISSTKQVLRFRSLISIVVDLLVGSVSQIMHITDAAASGLVNIRTREWNTNITTQHLSNIEFPSIVTMPVKVGNFLGTNIEVFCGVGDQQASLYGAEISERNLVVNIGTGGQVARLSSIVENFDFKIRPFFRDRYLSTFTHLPSGRFLDLVIKNSLKAYPGITTFEELNHLEWNSNLDIEDFDVAKNLNSSYHFELAKRIDKRIYLQTCLDFMVREYVKSIEKLGFLSCDTLVFAGGIGQKNLTLIREIVRRLNCENWIVSQQIETTIVGLKNISLDVT